MISWTFTEPSPFTSARPSYPPSRIIFTIRMISWTFTVPSPFTSPAIPPPVLILPSTPAEARAVPAAARRLSRCDRTGGRRAPVRRSVCLTCADDVDRAGNVSERAATGCAHCGGDSGRRRDSGPDAGSCASRTGCDQLHGSRCGHPLRRRRSNAGKRAADVSLPAA